jgi:hypothetical protein
MLTAVVVDPELWPTAQPTLETDAIEKMIRSDRWTGPVLLPTFDPNANVTDTNAIAKNRGLPARLVPLSPSREIRITTIRNEFVNARGLTLRGSAGNVPDAAPLPRNVGPVRESV